MNPDVTLMDRVAGVMFATGCTGRGMRTDQVVRAVRAASPMLAAADPRAVRDCVETLRLTCDPGAPR